MSLTWSCSAVLWRGHPFARIQKEIAAFNISSTFHKKKKKRNWMNFNDFISSFKSENALTETVQLYVKAASFILKRSTHLKTLNIGFYVSTLLYQVWNLNGRAACLSHSSLRFLILHLNFITVTWDRMPRMRHFQLAFGCPPQSLAACCVSGSAGIAREHHSGFQVRISP